MQATFCYRRAVLLLDPANLGVLASLHESFQSRRMRDAQQTVVAQMGRVRFGVSVAPEVRADIRTEPAASLDLADAIAQRFPKAGPRRLCKCSTRRSRGSTVCWATSDAVAIALLYLGHPEQVRGVWEARLTAPSAAAPLPAGECRTRRARLRDGRG